jgi:hypothetical protein
MLVVLKKYYKKRKYVIYFSYTKKSTWFIRAGNVSKNN